MGLISDKIEELKKRKAKIEEQGGEKGVKTA